MTMLEWKKGVELHGFAVEDVIPLTELNATMIRLRHLNTGARMVHLDTADDNNLFGVGFRTTPMDSTGVAHILEHTVLCGSRRYPVRDPFFSMIKRSLNTFMNALTSSDWTLYPFSSQNEKDFYNLMGVYLDAAFFPLLRERDFRQEGHRLEFAEPENPSSPLVRKGVVYNEMKGAMADPSSLIGRRLTKALYPTTTYHYNSGGEPPAIPELTWKGLKEFHARYYHPSNAWFFTYGTFPLEKHLQTIEDLALRHFGPRQVNTEVGDEVRLKEPLRATETFPLDAGETLEDRSMVQVAWLTCPVADSFERLSMSLLSNLLLGNPAAPLYKALLDSKLGRNLAPATGYHDDYRETFFATGLQGTNPESTEKIEELILNTLEEIAGRGFSRERIEAAIHQLEFSHREVTGDQYPYPLILLMRIMGPWLHNDDPVTPLLLEKDLERLRREIEAGHFFENLIRRHLLDNPHRVTLLLRPDPQQKDREEREAAARMTDLQRTLSEEEKEEIVRNARELQDAQEAQEDLSVLPTLEISDIPAEERRVPFRKGEREGVPVFWLDQPTNGIGYFTASLPLTGLAKELIPYVPLFCSVLTQIGAAGRTYEEMAERISASTGGIRATTCILDDPEDLGRFRAEIHVKGKALMRNQDKLFEILQDVFRAPDFTDLDRLQTVIGQVRISLENSIPSAGHSYAARAAASRLTPAGSLRDTWGGLQHIRLVREIASRKKEDFQEVAQKLRTIGDFLLERTRMRCAITAEDNAFDYIGKTLDPFLGHLSTRPGSAGEIPGIPPGERQGTGWATSVPVSYVARVFRTVPFTHPDSAPLMVLSRLLRSGYLHREIREKGGAYGGMANCDAEAGTFSMLSYRDPNLTRTLRVYRDAVEWAAAGTFSEEDLKEAILAVFSSIDRPLSPGGKGYREFSNQLQGLSAEMRQRLRENILGTDRKTLMRVAGTYLRDGWQESVAAVVSGEEMLKKANEELGADERLRIEKI